MSYQDKIVDVKVELGTQPIDTVGFETPMFLAMHNVFPERVRAYVSLNSMVEDGFAVGSPAYKFASNAFAGNFAPQMVFIGRQALTETIADFTGQVNTAEVVLNITVAGRTKAVKQPVTGGTATPESIADGLAATIGADDDLKSVVTATSASGALTLKATAGDPLSVGKGAGNYVIKNESSETVATALPLVMAENSNWYFLCTESHVDADLVAAAEYAMANYRLHVYTSATPDAVAAPNVNTSIFDRLHDLGYESLGQYSKAADVDFPEGALVGGMAANDPSYGDSMHLKQLPGVVDDKLTETQRMNAWGRNANIYRTINGVGAFIEGRVSNSQYVDVIRFAHWFKFRTEESVFAYMHRRSNMGLSMKMSDDDMPVLKSIIMNNPIGPGIRNGAILTGYDSVNGVSYDPTITIPRRAEIPTNDLANRILENVKVEVVYNNSLHYVKIRASVVLDRPRIVSTNAQTSTVGV